MSDPQWRVDENNDSSFSQSEFGKTVAAIARGEYVPAHRVYPPFRKMYHEEPIHNPSIANANQSLDLTGKLTDNTRHNRGPTFALEDRFKKYPTSPSKPEDMYEKPEKYWGRTRKVNTFYRAKMTTRPQDRSAEKALRLHRESAAPAIGPTTYQIPDPWVTLTSPSNGRIKPLPGMESTSKRELFDYLHVPTTDENMTIKNKYNKSPTKRIIPSIATSPPPLLSTNKMALSPTSRKSSPNNSPSRSPARVSSPINNTTINANNNINTKDGLLTFDDDVHQTSEALSSSFSRSNSQRHFEASSASPKITTSTSSSNIISRDNSSSPRGAFSFSKSEASIIEIDNYSVQYRRIKTADGTSVIIPVFSKSDVLEFAPTGSTIAETWATICVDPIRDDHLCCLTPQKMSFSTSNSLQQLQKQLKADDYARQKLQNQSKSLQIFNTSKRPSSLSTSYLSASDALPHGESKRSPVRYLKHREWKPPVIPGKSFLRKACEERQLDALLHTKSRYFPPETSAGVPIGLADSRLVHTTPADPSYFLNDTSSSNNKEMMMMMPAIATRAGTTSLIRSTQRGGGDVLGVNRRHVTKEVIAEASSRSTNLLSQMEQF